MKKISAISLSLIALLFFLCSCDNSENNYPSDERVLEDMQANIGELPYGTVEAIFFTSSGQPRSRDGMLEITGTLLRERERLSGNIEESEIEIRVLYAIYDDGSYEFFTTLS